MLNGRVIGKQELIRVTQGERFPQHFINVLRHFNPNRFQNWGGHILEVFFIFCRNDDPLNPTPMGGQDLLFQATYG